MHAIIEADGRQIKVTGGVEIKTSRLQAEPGAEVVFDKVLAVIKEEGEGEKSIFGTPYVENAKVNAEVIENGKDKKVMVFKQKTRKGHRKLRGHRQYITTLKIKEIVLGG